MLLNLHVKNMALIKELDIDFSEGLNILTGETGAGKSIIIGSINVALGMQSFKDFVRDDTDNALVELIFTAQTEPILQKMKELDLPMEDGQLILSRRLTNGRSISKINGETVPVSTMKEMASVLIDIHGQHEHQSLLYQKNHLKILDEFAKEELSSLKETATALYEVYAAKKQEWKLAQLDETQRRKELDFLQYEVSEIERCNLQLGEDEELEQCFKKMLNAKKIAQDASEAYQLTAEGERNASDAVSRALQRLLTVSGYDAELSELADQLAQMENLLTDFNRELAEYLTQLTFDEQEFLQIEERLNMINHMKTKYGKSIEEILNVRKEKEERLQQLLDYDEYLRRLKQEYEESEKHLLEQAKRISEVRSKYAKRLATVIQEELKDLNFLETRFEISVQPTAPLSAEGMDEVCFLISMNPGSLMKPLAQVASGGELSRIMLALKTVLAEKDEMPSLIFDEIDVGISGRTAQKVSEKMAVIARNHQVLCITHLAQIASMADAHYLIEKNVQNAQTVTQIRHLEEKESIQELARILGGAQITELTLQSAQEMKKMAENTKKY